MTILIDIGHPAHVHYFRNLYHELVSRHELIITSKSNPNIEKLLTYYGMDYIPLGDKGKGLCSKLAKQVDFNRSVFRILKSRKVEISMGSSSTAVQASMFTKSKSILFDDDDQAVQPFTKYFVAPFADHILSPDVLAHEKLKHAIYYPGYQELTYLHPKRFSPDRSVPAK